MTPTLPDVLPIFPLAGALLLPRGRLPLNIFEPRYLAMVEDALAGSRTIGMIQPAGPNGGVHPVGCAGRISSFAETEDGRYLITLTGLCRFTVAQELEPARGYRRVRPDWSSYADDLLPEAGLLADRDHLLDQLQAYFQVQGLSCDWEAVRRTDDVRLVTLLSMICPFVPDEKQALLEAPSFAERERLLVTFMELALVRSAGPAARCH